MSAENIAHTIATAQGWTDTTLLALCLDYIGNQSSDDAFADYLHVRADGENDGRRTACEGCGEPTDNKDSHGTLICEECDDDSDDDDGRDYEVLHGAADAFASDLNNSHVADRQAFLLASGVSQDSINCVIADAGDDATGALDDLVIEVCSQVASNAFNDGATDGAVVTALLEATASDEEGGEDGVERPGASDAYPNGRCTACGFGLDENGLCFQSDCSNFDENSTYADAGHTTAGGPGATDDDSTDLADADPDEEYGPYDLTCAHCGNALNGDNFDHTGSQRCDDLDPEHRLHRAVESADGN